MREKKEKEPKETLAGGPIRQRSYNCFIYDLMIIQKVMTQIYLQEFLLNLDITLRKA